MEEYTKSKPDMSYRQQQIRHLEKRQEDLYELLYTDLNCGKLDSPPLILDNLQSNLSRANLHHRLPAELHCIVVFYIYNEQQLSINK